MASRRAGVHVSAANTASRARCVSRSDPSQTSTVSGRPAASWKNSPPEKAARSLTCVRSMSPPTRSSWPPIRAVRQSSAPAPTVRVRSPSCTRPSDPVIAPVTSSSRAGRSLVGRVERVPCRTSIDADTCVAPPSGLCHDPREARVLAVRRFSRPGAASGRSANGTSFVVERRSTKPTTLADAPVRPPDHPPVHPRRPGDGVRPAGARLVAVLGGETEAEMRRERSAQHRRGPEAAPGPIAIGEARIRVQRVLRQRVVAPGAAAADHVDDAAQGGAAGARHDVQDGAGAVALVGADPGPDRGAGGRREDERRPRAAVERVAEIEGVEAPRRPDVGGRAEGGAPGHAGRQGQDGGGGVGAIERQRRERRRREDEGDARRLPPHRHRGPSPRRRAERRCRSAPSHRPGGPPSRSSGWRRCGWRSPADRGRGRASAGTGRRRRCASPGRFRRRRWPATVIRGAGAPAPSLTKPGQHARAGLGLQARGRREQPGHDEYQGAPAERPERGRRVTEHKGAPPDAAERGDSPRNCPGCHARLLHYPRS